MKKGFLLITIVLLLLQIFSISSFAETYDNNQYDEVIDKPADTEISKKEKAISFLLEAGWSMKNIQELETEALLAYANALTISGQQLYTVSYENENEEIISELLTKQEFDYGVNSTRDASDQKLTTLSADGVLTLDTIDVNDNGGESGYNKRDNTSACYLSQELWVTWMGSDRYIAAYRYEWETMPKWNMLDVFGITFDECLMLKERTFLCYSYKVDNDLYGTQSKSTPQSSGWIGNGVFCKEVVDITECFQQGDSVIVPGENARGYMQFNTYINNTAPTQRYFKFWSFYYHARGKIDVNANISISADGPSGGFTITPKKEYHREENNNYVYVKNPYCTV